MTDESAAGQKTGQDNGRCDRVAGVMEERLADCNSVLGSFMAKVDKNGGYGEDDLRYLAAYLKIGAQLAGQIARLENIKNRGSIPQ